MKLVRVALLAIACASLAAACGGKNKDASTTVDNKGGDMASGSGSDMGSGSATGGDMYGGNMYGGDMGGNPCGD